MRKFNMFITAICVLFLVKVQRISGIKGTAMFLWQKTKKQNQCAAILTEHAWLKFHGKICP